MRVAPLRNAVAGFLPGGLAFYNESSAATAKSQRSIFHNTFPRRHQLPAPARPAAVRNRPDSKESDQLRGIRKGASILLLASGLIFRQPASAFQDDAASDLWLSRARALTDELVKDADALGRHDGALLKARLGRAWARDDAERARDWEEQAVHDVESAPDDEKADERAARLKTTRSLLVILGSHDKALSARLNKVIAAASEAATPHGDPETAKAKAEAGLAVLDSDPQRALQFGLASLRAGGSYKLASLLWRLRKRDVKLSDTLFAKITAAARARGYDPDLLNVLPVVAFEGPSPSDALRENFLAVLGDGLLRVPAGPQEQSALCKLAPVAAPLLPEFQRLLPQRAAAVRAQVGRCRPGPDAAAHKESDDALREQPLDTVDALLDAAGKTSDPERRVTYLNRAAYKSAGERKYERAISILDGLDGRERELTAGVTGAPWDSWRSEFASAAAVAFLRRGDRASMNRIIYGTPAHLRPSVQMSAAAELLKSDAAAATQLLNEARAALARSSSPQDFATHLALARLYAALNQPDALLALADAVKAMNQGGDARGAEAETPLLSNDLLLGLYRMPAALLEMDDAGVRQMIAAADSPARRAAMRLNLLAASLERRRASADRTPQEKRVQADHVGGRREAALSRRAERGRRR